MALPRGYPGDYPSFPNDAYPPHLNAAVDALTLRALAEANDARAGYPGPLAHRGKGDITAVLMRMVEDGVLLADTAALIAWARSLNPKENGAYFTRLCKPRVLWHGLDYDARAFNQLYSDECANCDIAIDGLPMTGGLGARQKPVEWLWVDDTLEWSPLSLLDRWRPSQRVADVLVVAVIVVGLPVLGWCVWQVLSALVTLWPLLSGNGW